MKKCISKILMDSGLISKYCSSLIEWHHRSWYFELKVWWWLSCDTRVFVSIVKSYICIQISLITICQMIGRKVSQRWRRGGWAVRAEILSIRVWWRQTLTNEYERADWVTETSRRQDKQGDADSEDIRWSTLRTSEQRRVSLQSFESWRVDCMNTDGLLCSFFRDAWWLAKAMTQWTEQEIDFHVERRMRRTINCHLWFGSVT